ncbi:MAG: hypothetical protein JXL97_03820 [Bacteroidales bacterium]|nr:hypothetical protein [Bacteroidales bacterium]
MVNDDEIKKWAQIAESLGGQVGMGAYSLFDRISVSYKEDSNIIDRLNDMMKSHTKMNETQIKTFTKAAEEYCLKYS